MDGNALGPVDRGRAVGRGAQESVCSSLAFGVGIGLDPLSEPAPLSAEMSIKMFRLLDSQSGLSDAAPVEVVGS